MELTFHNQDEFESFARVYMRGLEGSIAVTHAVGELRQTVSAPTAAQVTEILADMTEAPLEMLGNGSADPADEGIVHEHIDLPPADETEQEPEKPKRKRRSKAEIAADEAAEHRTLDPAVQAPRDEMPMAEFMQTFVPPMVEPIAEAINAGERAASEVEADKPKHQASAESLEKHAAAQAEYTPELIETLKGQAELFDANRTAHLNEGREAIAKHGFIKYMATFKGLGLDSAIATYNDDQVKLHRAAIAHLMAT